MANQTSNSATGSPLAGSTSTEHAYFARRATGLVREVKIQDAVIFNVLLACEDGQTNGKRRWHSDGERQTAAPRLAGSVAVATGGMARSTVAVDWPGRDSMVYGALGSR
jgi:hypothetical protein